MKRNKTSFVVLPLHQADTKLVQARLEELRKTQHLKLGDNGFLVWYDTDQIQELASELLKATDKEPISGMVLTLKSAFGYLPSSVGDWLRRQAEQQKNLELNSYGNGSAPGHASSEIV